MHKGKRSPGEEASGKAGIRQIEIHVIDPKVKVLNPQPPIPGFSRFICTYLLEGDAVALIDGGPTSAVPGLLAALDKAGVAPEAVDYIILTHIHIDHAGGTGTLLKSLPNANVLAHSRARPHLIRPEKLWQASLSTLGDLALQYGQIEPVPEGRIVVAQEGTKIKLGENLEIEVCLTPGHAAHHLSLFNSASRMLFAGEAGGVCVNGYVRPATPAPFDLGMTLASLDKLIAMKPERICYGHFDCYGEGLARLLGYRSRLQRWYEVANSRISQYTDPQAMLAIMREVDSDLDYLDRLDKDEYEREVTLIINSIYGLAGLARG